MVECVVVEPGSVAVWCTGLVVFLVGGEVVVVDFALTGMGGRLGSGKTDLVGHSTGTAILDSMGGVGVDEVILLESEPVNVDLECGSGNDLDNLSLASARLE